MMGRSFTAWLFCLAWAAASIVILSDGAVAASLYWDTNGSTAGIGSGGGAAANWLTNSWANGSSGTLPSGAWPNTQPDNDDGAVFMGTAGTVNINADVYANALTFQTNGYSIASTGGGLHLAGTDPTITVNLPSGNNTATISAPILGDNGFTVEGNSLTGGLKFLVLANTDAAIPNAFAGTLTVEAGGALRLGGGVAREQIPDQVGLAVSGVLDFVTSNGASDGKQEKVRNVAVSGTNANFSIGNEADFVVNSISAVSTGSGQAIALNGNNGLAPAPHAPGRLIINGWADGTGDLTLDNGRVQFNVTSASTGVGGRVLVSGNIYSSGSSQIYNNNGGTTPEDNHFDNKALDFTNAAHTIDVANGTLTLTSRTTSQYVDVTSTNPGGTILTKTGAGVLLYEYAAQTSFTGTNRIEQGTLRLGDSERLASNSRLEVAGGTFDMQGFSERVGDLLLEGGLITATGAGVLSSTSIEVQDGVIQARLAGAAGLTKSSAGTVALNSPNIYTGTTAVSGGTLLVNSSHTGGDAYSVDEGATLGGNGTITAPVLVNGIIALGASIGTLTVSGNVTFGANSHFGIQLSGTTSDLLAVTGDIDLSAMGNALDVTGVGTGDSWVIAIYTGTLSGVFESISAGFSVNYGTGSNSQITLLVAEGLTGDYNNDNNVNAADYTVWRNNLGGLGTALEHRDSANGSGPVNIADYNSWKAHFGEGSGNGGLSNSSEVPEPGSVASLTLCLSMVLYQRLTAGRRYKSRAVQ